jgi:pimeloyl-ACP methyl ester carboxylesterase
VLPETFIIRELIPYVDANYRTIKDRRGRWVEGMSMGGNGALKFALKFPDLFSSVVAYAGSYEPLPKDGFLYPGVAPEFRVWLQALAQWYTPDHDPFELAKFNRYRLNSLRIRLVAGTMDVALKDSEALHKYFEEIGVAHEYDLYPREQTARGIIDHFDQVDPFAATFQPFMGTGVPLHQFAVSFPSLPPLMNFCHSLSARPPQACRPHPLPRRFFAHLDTVLLGQILGGQRWPETLIHISLENLDRLLLLLLVDPPVGAASQSVQHCLVADLSQSDQ